MKPQIESKVQGYFDALENALQVGDVERAEIFIGKLSKYFHLFDDELTDYYQYAQDVIDSYWEEGSIYDEPTELEEWLDFDPDC
jgi:hypothetical protein